MEVIGRSSRQAGHPVGGIPPPRPERAYEACVRARGPIGAHPLAPTPRIPRTGSYRRGWAVQGISARLSRATRSPSRRPRWPPTARSHFRPPRCRHCPACRCASAHRTRGGAPPATDVACFPPFFRVTRSVGRPPGLGGHRQARCRSRRVGGTGGHSSGTADALCKGKERGACLAARCAGRTRRWEGVSRRPP